MADKTVALITGGSRGIGKAIAERFLREGISVAITARDAHRLEKTAEELRSTGNGEVFEYVADLRKPEDISALVEAVMKHFGKIDILVNNAGIMYLKPVIEMTLEEFQAMWEVNMQAVFLLTRAVLPSMIERKSGTIINIASLAGKNGFKNGSGYVATKFALRGFAASVMQEVREHDIRIITVFPGSVNTDLIRRSPTAPRPETMLQPEDVAHAVYAAYAVHPRAMMSEIDIRPSNPKRD